MLGLDQGRRDEELHSSEAFAASGVGRSGKSWGRLLNSLWGMSDNVLCVVFRGDHAREWEREREHYKLLAATSWRYSSPRSGLLL